MNRKISVAALFLVIVLLLGAFGACQENNLEEEPETVGTTAVSTPKATAPETSAPAETTAPPSTEEPPEECFSVWKSDRSESFLAGAEDDAPLYASRAERFRTSSGIAIRETVMSNLQESVKAGRLSGMQADILLLQVQEEGAPLLCAGVLQDLSATGIDITAASGCAVPSLTENLSFDSHLFLLPYRGLLSDISATFALSVKNGTDAAQRVKQAFAEGTYSLDTVFSYLKDWETIDPEEFETVNEGSSEEYFAYEVPAIGGGSKALEGVFSALGGWVMIPETVPTVHISSESFAAAYHTAAGIAPYLSDREEIISVSVLSERNKQGRTVYPLPPISSAGIYAAPVDAEGLTVVAAMSGLVYGQKTAELLGLLSDLTAEWREQLTHAADIPKETADILFSTGHMELAKIYTWGDLYALTFDRLGSESYASLLETENLTNRIRAANSAAEIVRSRYS